MLRCLNKEKKIRKLRLSKDTETSRCLQSDQCRIKINEKRAPHEGANARLQLLLANSKSKRGITKQNKKSTESGVAPAGNKSHKFLFELKKIYFAVFEIDGLVCKKNGK